MKANLVVYPVRVCKASDVNVSQNMYKANDMQHMLYEIIHYINIYRT